MPGRLSFVRADRRHVDDIVSVARAIVAEMGPQRAALPESLTAEALARRMARYRGRGAIFLAREGRRPVAFAMLEPERDDPQTFALGVWVLPEHRRRGLGRELALMAIEHARARGCRRLRGLIPPENEAALSFFGDIGAYAQAVGGGMQYELPS